MRSRLLWMITLGIVTCLSSLAYAQPKPQSVVTTVPSKVATYTAGFATLTPAASGTDFFTLTGSATSVIRVKRVECSGTSTAAANNVVEALMRSTADTGGTSTTPAATLNDSNDSAASAVVHAYTVNPTVGTVSGSVVRVGLLTTATTASAAIASKLEWIFGNNFDKEPTLRGTAQVFALNANAASFSAGASLACDITWTETAF